MSSESFLAHLHVHLSQTWLQKPSGSRLILAVSGGIDSMALAHWIRFQSGVGHDTIHWAHVNHQIRPNSGQEADFIQSVAQKWGIPCDVLSGSAPDLADTSKQSLEAAARQLRYHLLGELAFHSKAAGVIVAHHADDQAETVLLHLLRGSGLNGLTGMRMLSPWPFPASNTAGLTLFRPMLKASRAEIEAYVAEHQIPYMEDPSNRDVRFTRNRLRHDLIPQLKAIQPNLIGVLNQLGDLVAAEVEVLEPHYKKLWDEQAAWGEGWVRFKRSDWQKFKLAEARALLRKALAHLSAIENLEFQHVESTHHFFLNGETGQQADVHHGVSAYIFYDDLILAPPAAVVQAFDAPQLPQPKIELDLASLRSGVSLSVSDSQTDQWQLRQVESPETGIPSAWVFPITADQLKGGCRLRSRRPGDRISPAGLDGSVSLKELMIDRKMPAPLRKNWPILVDSNNRILWVIGHRHVSPPEPGTTPPPLIWLSVQKW